MRKDWQLNLKWNVKIFRLINNKRSKFLDKFYKKFYLLGKSYSLVLFYPAFYLIGGLKPVIELTFALIIPGISMPLIKYTFRHKRPAKLLKDVNLLEPVNLRSFPSADTAYAFTIFGISLFFFPLWFILIMGIYAFLIAYGRIYMGAHFPLDVIVGAIIGLLSSYITHILIIHFQ